MMDDDFDRYNDDTVHNMWVDYTTEQYEDDGDDDFEYQDSGYGDLQPDYDEGQGSGDVSPEAEIDSWQRQQPTKYVGESDYRAERIAQHLNLLRQQQALCEQKLTEKLHKPVRRQVKEECEAVKLDIEKYEKQLAREQQNGRNLRVRQERKVTVGVGLFLAFIMYIMWSFFDLCW